MLVFCVELVQLEPLLGVLLIFLPLHLESFLLEDVSDDLNKRRPLLPRHVLHYLALLLKEVVFERLWHCPI